MNSVVIGNGSLRNVVYRAFATREQPNFELLAATNGRVTTPVTTAYADTVYSLTNATNSTDATVQLVSTYATETQIRPTVCDILEICFQFASSLTSA